MNRTLDATATILGIKPRTFRAKLREIGVLTQAGELAPKHRDQGYLYVDSRSRWNKNIHAYSHYAVVMVKETGVTWLADQLGITTMKKDAAA
ncbi:hypothetical protein ALP74_01328 [Pseudomonas coronafaciens pv. garcae]|uniref:Antirepressor protein C-terminal domain-containing protein n=1 Tax=Pseudomonas coronafaciens pv. garcae TaxID=251653 RepID=A0AB37QVS7_9PSED|nr:hypothetical protein HBB04_04613 [Pseudomonas coronafaciens]RMS06246.1 hypothetical protein ALP74_01328 [Pseudomonas coronafaciens pv. garcae]RMS17421.1 hypothetical protein ALP71_200223 [Pseudomonas coronafaciens pv. garcae]